MMIRRGRPRSAGTISYQINNRTELLAVLQNSGSAGTYTVAPGSYGDFDGGDQSTYGDFPNFASPVNLVSYGASIGGLIAKNIGNITFDGFEANKLDIKNPKNLTVKNCYIHGGDYLLSILDTDKSTSNVNILNNTIINAGIDCVRVCTGTGSDSGYATDILVEGNYLSEAGLLGNSHPDFVQSWGYAYTGVDGVFDLGRCGINNFTIRNNILLGDQEGPQGTFLNNEGATVKQIHAEGPVSATLTRNGGPGTWTTISASVTFSVTTWDNTLTATAGTFANIKKHDLFTVTGTTSNNLQFIALADGTSGTSINVWRYNMRHSNFLLENNFIVLNSPHGMTNTFVDGLTIKNNVMIGQCCDIPSALRTMGIIAQGYCRNISIEDSNILVANPTVSDSYIGTGSVANPATLYTQKNPQLATHLAKHFVNAQRRYAPIADDFQALGSSVLYSHPACVAYRAIKPASTLYIKPTQTWGLSSLAVTLDAVKIVDDSVNAGCTYDWDFGDGTSHGSGQSVNHTYSYQGEYYVTCAVTGAVTQTLRRTVIVRDPLISYLPLDTDLRDLGWDNPHWTNTLTSVDFSGEGVELGFDKPIIYATNTTRIDSSMPEVTFSFEFQKDTGDAFGIIARNFGFDFTYYSWGLRFSIYGIGYVEALTVYDGASWYRATGTYSSVTGALKLYIDNALVASASGLSGDAPAGLVAMQFGYDSAGSTFGGRVRNVVIISGIPMITGDAAKTAIDAFITARQYPDALPTAADKTVSTARSTTTSWDATVGATGGPWLPNWVSLSGTSGVSSEIGSAQDGLVHLAVGSAPGACSATYRLRNTRLKDSNAAAITVTVT